MFESWILNLATAQRIGFKVTYPACHGLVIWRWPRGRLSSQWFHTKFNNIHVNTKGTVTQCYIHNEVQDPIRNGRKLAVIRSSLWRTTTQFGCPLVAKSSCPRRLHHFKYYLNHLSDHQVQVQVQVFYLPNRSTWCNLQSVCSSFLEGGRTEKHSLSSCPPKYKNTNTWIL